MNEEDGFRLLQRLGVPEDEQEGKALGFANLPPSTRQILSTHFDKVVRSQ